MKFHLKKGTTNHKWQLQLTVVLGNNKVRVNGISNMSEKRNFCLSQNCLNVFYVCKSSWKIGQQHSLLYCTLFLKYVYTGVWITCQAKYVAYHLLTPSMAFSCVCIHVCVDCVLRSKTMAYIEPSNLWILFSACTIMCG